MSAVFREVVFVWAKGVDWAEVDARRPDLVFWQSAERYLATTAQS